MRLSQSHPASTSLFIPEQFHPAIYTRDWVGVNGIGDSTSDSSGSPSVSQEATTGIVGGVQIGFKTALTTGSKLAGGIAAGLEAAAPFAGPAAPFLMLAAGLIAPIYNMFKGCGDTCKEATTIANQAAAAIKQVTDAYWAQPVRYKASQLAALHTIETVAGYINSACGNPALGAAGQRCISERTVRGGSAPWCPTGTGCDMWTVNYDPIANDTGVVDDPGTTDTSTGSGQVSVGSFSIPMPLILGGAALLGIIMLTGGDN